MRLPLGNQLPRKKTNVREEEIKLLGAAFLERRTPLDQERKPVMLDTFFFAFNAVTPMLLLMLLGCWLKAKHFFDDALLK